jgi:quinolinate synthase
MNGKHARIESIRSDFGNKLLILGHHYQRPEVLKHADAIGDSLELARRASKEKNAEWIVFCGVRFMAESADVLTSPSQTVYMPESEAGCPMAAMANADDVTSAWEFLKEEGGEDWLPVVYVNSTAEIKALCGKWGGSTCTSSNATKVFKWVRDKGKRVFFLPDEHLGVNTANAMKIADAKVQIYDPTKERGGLTPQRLAKAEVLAWKGHCHVHTTFKPSHIRAARRADSDAKIIVHPETPRKVLDLADASGSTSQIIQYVADARKGSTIVIGTESTLVERLAEQNADRLVIKKLSLSVCPNMYMTTESSLSSVLEGWQADNEVHVKRDLIDDARKALNRMLKI